MDGQTTDINICMDAELKKQADELFAELGLDLTTAVHVFIRQCLRESAIPFRISLYPSNREAM